MQCIGHANAPPPVGIDREMDNVSGLRVDFRGLKDLGETYADPLGDLRQALFTLQHRDLAVRRVTFRGVGEGLSLCIHS